MITFFSMHYNICYYFNIYILHVNLFYLLLYVVLFFIHFMCNNIFLLPTLEFMTTYYFAP